MDLIPPSVVEGYDVSHLHTLAAHMTKGVADREELMGAVNGLTAGQMWVGAGREGQAVPLAEHNVQATTTAAALAGTAAEATAGAETLYLQKQELVAGLQVGKTAGFEVDDEYNVTDPFEGTPAGVIRAPLARTLQSQLQAGAQVFTQTEHATAQAIHTSMGTVGGGTAAHLPTGKVQCFGPEDSDGAVNCFEPDGKGGGTTFKGIWAQEGNWPDKATLGEGKTSMLDNHFKTGPSDPTEPPMPPIGGEPHEDMLIPTQSGAASTQSGLGVEDTKLPAMPKEWPVNHEPVPGPAPCKPGEFATDTFDVAASTAATTAGGLLFPLEGPLMVPSALALAKGVETIIETSDTETDCIERGFGG